MAGEIGDLRNPTRIFFKSSIFSIDSTFRSRFEDATSNSLSDERVLLSGDSVAGRFQELGQNFGDSIEVRRPRAAIASPPLPLRLLIELKSSSRTTARFS
ncbi:unnamed protein product [Linum trigynum]|uniref:Uncharacterized protein n=1 Tax=Linum trigynum TaxID=586398 RepID=A0AAV2DJD9_9ROSI